MPRLKSARNTHCAELNRPKYQPDHNFGGDQSLDCTPLRNVEIGNSTANPDTSFHGIPHLQHSQALVNALIRKQLPHNPNAVQKYAELRSSTPASLLPTVPVDNLIDRILGNGKSKQQNIVEKRLRTDLINSKLIDKYSSQVFTNFERHQMKDKLLSNNQHPPQYNDIQPPIFHDEVHPIFEQEEEQNWRQPVFHEAKEDIEAQDAEEEAMMEAEIAREDAEQELDDAFRELFPAFGAMDDNELRDARLGFGNDMLSNEVRHYMMSEYGPEQILNLQLRFKNREQQLNAPQRIGHGLKRGSGHSYQAKANNRAQLMKAHMLKLRKLKR